jgi:anti-sigma regulatory factor (Ser/Thr protein kinase)
MAKRSFPASVESVPAARRFVAASLAGLPADVTQRAQLLVSELATNALLHASGGFEVSAVYSARTQRLRVGVSDVGEGAPKLERPDTTQEHGRGVQLVAAISDRWGVERHGRRPGKTVWFELAARAPVMSDDGGR